MISISEVFKGFEEGFTNKDSRKLAELLTDDFQFVTAVSYTHLTLPTNREV